MTGLNPDQFSAAELPVYQGGVNTGTNWGENTMVSPSTPSGGVSDQYDMGGGGGNNNRRRRDNKDMELNPNYGWAVVPALAGAALKNAAGVGNSVASLGAGVLGRIAQGAESIGKSVVGGVEGAVKGAANVGQEVLRKEASIGQDVIGAGKGLLEGAVGIGKDVVGAGEKLAGPLAHFSQDVNKKALGGAGWLGEQVGGGAHWLGEQFGKLGEPLGAAVDAIEPSGGLIGDIPRGLGALAGETPGWLGGVVESIENIPSNIDKIWKDAGSPGARNKGSGGLTGVPSLGPSTAPAPPPVLPIP